LSNQPFAVVKEKLQMRAIFFNATAQLRTGWRLLLFIALVAVAGRLIGVIRRLTGLPREIVDGVVQPIPELLIGILIIFSVLGILALLFRWFEKRPLSTIGLPFSKPWLRGMSTGFTIGGLNIAIYVLILLINGNAHISLSGLTIFNLLQSTLPLFIALLAFSGWEELAMRGYSLQMFAEAWGPHPAAIITGVIFGLLHIENPGASIPGLVFTAIGGVLLAWLVIRTGSLWIAWGYHAGWNIVAALLFGLRVSGMDHPGAILETQISGENWLAGGDYGFEGSTIIGCIEFMVLSVTVILANHLPGHPDLIRYFKGKF
jgi:membrane protease YdiL (CAAX protease family)